MSEEKKQVRRGGTFRTMLSGEVLEVAEIPGKGRIYKVLQRMNGTADVVSVFYGRPEKPEDRAYPKVKAGEKYEGVVRTGDFVFPA